MKDKQKCAAVLLAGGSGKRMGADIPKQFLPLDHHPLLYYSLRCFQESELVDQIILVSSAETMEACRGIVGQYHFSKVSALAEGGKERYDSVYAGLIACPPDTEYVCIHDSARPFVTQAMIRSGIQAAMKTGAAAIGMPSKDTIKLTDSQGKVLSTPDRKKVWIVQTPQIFSYPLILRAHEEMRKRGMEGITDDAMLLERTGLAQVQMVEGAYTNIKITTPEDIPLAQSLLRQIS